jgi:anti-sigma factor RsiW
MSAEAPAAIRCRELVELVTDYIEGALSPADVARFEHHLSLCDGCHAYVDQMRGTIRALGYIPASSLSDEASEHLLAAFRDWRSSR